MKSILIFIALSQIGCASELIADGEYGRSRILILNQDLSGAHESLPKKEANGFVTTIEKNWIKLWAQEADPEELIPLGNQIDSRRFLSLSKEAQYFFFNETEDGYIPAEHEVVALHLITAMSFIQKNKLVEAEVEARRAAFYLQGYYPEDHPHFDDEFLRAWLAGVWIAIGKDEEAQVDLRKIYELNGQQLYMDLANKLDDKTSKWKINFRGIGPDIKWYDSPFPTFESPRLINPHSGAIDSNVLLSKNWYSRLHFRNNMIRDELTKSKYMTQYYGIKFNANLERASGQISTTALKIIGFALSALLIEAGFRSMANDDKSHSLDSYAATAAIGSIPAYYAWTLGEEMNREIKAHAYLYEKSGVDSLRTFRFIRFLPSEIKISESKSSDDYSNIKFSSPNGKIIFNWRP